MVTPMMRHLPRTVVGNFNVFNVSPLVNVFNVYTIIINLWDCLKFSLSSEMTFQKSTMYDANKVLFNIFEENNFCRPLVRKKIEDDNSHFQKNRVSLVPREFRSSSNREKDVTFKNVNDKTKFKSQSQLDQVTFLFDLKLKINICV